MAREYTGTTSGERIQSSPAAPDPAWIYLIAKFGACALCSRRGIAGTQEKPHMSFVAAVHRKAVELGKLSVEMTTAAGSGHPSTALSLAHLVTVLMYHQMRWDPKDPWNPAADRLVLSEGHAVPILYAAYADLGGVIVPKG